MEEAIGIINSSKSNRSIVTPKTPINTEFKHTKTYGTIITQAAQKHNVPVSISFTVETDGALPTTGENLSQAIQAVDQATARGGPVYYMINCAHPTHFAAILEHEICRQRLRGERANASHCSHSELDEAVTLDDGGPFELGRQIAAIRQKFPFIKIIGGCCGTNYRQIEQVALNCA